MKSNKYKKVHITIQDRITLYKQAIENLEEEAAIGKYYGWCFALTYAPIMSKLGIGDIYTSSIFIANFRDLLKYSLKFQKNKNIVGYLFTCDKAGYRHRIAVLEYGIKQLKEQLNK
jgi:hypothetical protein